MTTGSFVGRFDLDLGLRDASLDPANRPTRRMLAAAAIGTEVNDAYYAAVELREAIEWVHDGHPGENGGAKLDHGGGGEVLLRAA